MYTHNTTRTKNGSLPEIIAANFDSSFLIPLSARYSTGEWNAALRKAIAIRAWRNRSGTT
jgi:hypothetical protein